MRGKTAIHAFTVILSFFILLITISYPTAANQQILGDRDLEAQSFLRGIELEISKKCRESAVATFNYEINVTKENEDINTKISLEVSEAAKEVQELITAKLPWWNELSCPRLKKQLRGYFLGGPGNITADRIELSMTLGAEMTGAYAKATVCHFQDKTKCDLHLEPDLVDIMKSSTNYDELSYYWTAWHDTMSNAVPSHKYFDFIQLDNEGARANGFKDNGEVTADAYNDGTPNWTFEKFQEQMKESWITLKPYYMKLHAYVRIKLKKFYGDKINHPQGFLPANILGNMWSQEWDNIEKLTKPFPAAPSLDATEALKKKGYTVERMFVEADKFYQDMGLLPMNENFWKKSLFVRPTDGRDVICHATAFDFCVRNKKGTKGDYRIKMCAEVDQYNFGTIHHEMGHTEYQMHYAHQPYQFRNGANPGFHEAIGDALALAVTTPKHLECVLGLDMGAGIDCNSNGTTTTANSQKVTDSDYNLLFFRSLQKMAFLPFAYSMEYWKWEVFAGKIGPDEYNDRWWEIRKENQGIIPPTNRPSYGFDPSAKFHIVADVEYIRYFWSNILEFQFFQAMCITAGEYNPNDPNTKPLYQCDFSGSKKAGQKLASMMSLGSSRAWPDALELMTGERELSSKAMLNYFKPIFEYMEKELAAANEPACFGENCFGENNNPSSTNEQIQNSPSARKLPFWDSEFNK